ncbi:MarR family winged helix-turn-helix transcriptional regulator [Sinorhizobium meliloti]|jgi:MarR family transcriptional regulator for hemolysin|uniref:MarR family transcriptional regulator n=1 Tax=Rhizobium meliloti TaxID=382 RepID=A0A6A7ZPI0_RHIML|nr:MarR family transcriptional regulator [Sinorhizobium meliloti]MDW9373368.1 MarR family transcriptional regulator [Sinorhizobium meliloti]MDW9490969.1 MarR family transcriptional regulator [Sinorhizobium meliloti]MDW9559493.1 MarR family transcriptional regulator [Sinorhizobium meliloti]MDW9635845.1 MarR family transcriptional regulator [Sinorhizobium meliloti]MDW9646768.1 MarR family transcriptional regulator [Sinorhizobium meliloti]
MPKSSDNRQLFDALATVNRKLRSVFDARVKERGLTLPRARMLFALARKEGLNQRELAEELDIETPTIVRLLDGMEKQGFIERRVELSDRRAKQIHMTDVGRSVADEIQKLASDIREEVLGGLQPQEIAVALKVVSKIATNIQSIGRSGDR